VLASQATSSTVTSLATGVSSSGTYYLRVKVDTAGYGTQNGYSITGNFFAGDLNIELEGNESSGQATALSSGQPSGGQLSSATDVDYYALTVTTGGTISVDFSAPSTTCYSSAYNCWNVAIVNSAGTVLASRATSSTVTSLATGVSTSGTYYLRVKVDTAGYGSQNGYSITGNFFAGDLNIELEGNESSGQATALSSGQPFGGQLSSATDVDYFALTVTTGGTISVDFSAPSTTCYSSAYNCWNVAIVNSAGTVLASQATSSTVTSLATGVSTSGTYYLRVKVDTAGYGTQNGYSITGNFFAGDLNIELESNDSIAQATVLSSGQPFGGQLSSVTDVDYFALTVTTGGTISVDFSAPSTTCYSSAYNCWNVAIVNSAGTVLASQATSSTVTSLATGVSTSGTYYLRVKVDTAGYGTQKAYTIKASGP
jgi:hypothetical protein